MCVYVQIHVYAARTFFVYVRRALAGCMCPMYWQAIICDSCVFLLFSLGFHCRPQEMFSRQGHPTAPHNVAAREYFGLNGIVDLLPPPGLCLAHSFLPYSGFRSVGQHSGLGLVAWFGAWVRFHFGNHFLDIVPFLCFDNCRTSHNRVPYWGFFIQGTLDVVAASIGSHDFC